jgi:hypothetical protein
LYNLCAALKCSNLVRKTIPFKIFAKVMVQPDWTGLLIFADAPAPGISNRF